MSHITPHAVRPGRVRKTENFANRRSSRTTPGNRVQDPARPRPPRPTLKCYVRAAEASGRFGCTLASLCVTLMRVGVKARQPDGANHSLLWGACQFVEKVVESILARVTLQEPEASVGFCRVEHHGCGEGEAQGTIFISAVVYQATLEFAQGLAEHVFE